MPFFAALWANPLVRKITMYGAIALAALWLLRLHDNRVRDDQDRKTTIKVRDQVMKEHEGAWKVQQEELDSLRQGLIADKAAIDKDRANVLAGRTAIVQTLTTGQARLATKIEELKPYIATVPATELDQRIREALNGLR